MVGPEFGRLDRRWVAGAAVVVAVATALLIRAGDAHRLDVRAPEPSRDAPELAVPALPASVFSVPIEVDLAPLVEVVERTLPRSFGDLEDRREIPGQSHLSAAVHVERSPVSIRYVDSTATLSSTLSYRARAWYDPPILPAVSASCGTGDGEPAPRLRVELRTPLTLDREWRLRSRIAPGPMVPLTDADRDRCRVTPLRFDMTGRVVDAARSVVRDFGPRADSAIADLDLRDHFAGWWGVIAEPIGLADDVWLVLGPEAVGRGPILGDGGTIRTSLTLRARPRVVIAGVRPDVEAAPLPPLETIPPDDGLRILAEARAEYGETTRLLLRELEGREFSAGGRTLRVDDVSLSGVGDGRLSVRVRVRGDARGDLYLVGTPVYDTAADQITVPDLDFDVATREALVAGAAWIVRLGLVDDLRRNARWPARPAVRWARDQVEVGFNSRISDEVRLEGTVDSVSVIGVLAASEALRVRAEVRGSATLVVERAGGSR